MMSRPMRVCSALALPMMLLAPAAACAASESGAPDTAAAATAGALESADGADFAADAGSESESIIVTGRIDGYRTIATTTGTKTDTDILNVPQAISVVTKDQLADQQIRSMADLVRLIPGVSSGQGEGHRDQINLRGNNSTADFFVDGLRDDVQYYRSFYNIERVEVHKGPNAMVFGRGGGGGLVNRVTKGPLAGMNRTGLTLSADSFGAYYGAGDVNLAMGDRAAIRVNGFYELLDNHRDAFDGERWAINPVIAADIGLRLQLGYEYVRDSRVVDRGVPSAFPGTLATPAGPARGLLRRFFGVVDANQSDFEAHVVNGRAEADLASNLKFSAAVLWGDYDKAYVNVYPASALSPAAPTTLRIEAYRDPTTRETLIAQSNVEWQISTGAVQHRILFGAEYSDQDTRNERINGFFALPATAVNRQITIPLASSAPLPVPLFVAGPGGNGNRAVQSRLDQKSLYVQDQIEIGTMLQIVAGLRYDQFRLSATNLFTNARFARTDDLWSPRLGVVLKPVETASIYASYTKSFLPQSGDQFINLDLTSAALKPERFDNYELGAKLELAPGLTGTLAVFRLDRSNSRAAGPTPGTVVLTGSQRTSGLELGLVGKIGSKLDIAYGYSYLLGRITSTTSAAPAGRTLAQLPRHQLSLWNKYALTDRFGIGLGLYVQSASFATISNATRLPGYARIDAAFFYDLSDTASVQLNIENLTDSRYFPYAHNDNNVSTGAPVNARLTLSIRL